MSSTTVTLTVLESFESFGKTHAKGEPFDLADAKGWPKGTLQRRIQNGFLGYDEEDLISEDDDEETDPDAKAVTALKAASGKGGRKFTLPGETKAAEEPTKE